MRIALSALLALVIALGAAPAVAMPSHPVLGQPAREHLALAVAGLPASLTVTYRCSRLPAWVGRLPASPAGPSTLTYPWVQPPSSITFGVQQ